MRSPQLSSIRQPDTHRLIPSDHGDTGASVLAGIADDDAHLQEIFELDHATDGRLNAENNLLPDIGIEELVFGIPRYRIINAAFCHAHPLGSRFNGSDRGARYAGFDVATSQAEVIFHKTVALAEIDHFHDSTTYDDILADFAGEFHDIRDDRGFADCLTPDSYVAAQRLAAQLLEELSAGIVYPSVRHAGGTNLVCFRPAMVGNVRLDASYRLTWDGSPKPSVEIVINR